VEILIDSLQRDGEPAFLVVGGNDHGEGRQQKGGTPTPDYIIENPFLRPLKIKSGIGGKDSSPAAIS
jgi:hypothetical protein